MMHIINGNGHVCEMPPILVPPILETFGKNGYCNCLKCGKYYRVVLSAFNPVPRWRKIQWYDFGYWVEANNEDAKGILLEKWKRVAEILESMETEVV